MSEVTIQVVFICREHTSCGDCGKACRVAARSAATSSEPVISRDVSAFRICAPRDESKAYSGFLLTGLDTDKLDYRKLILYLFAGLTDMDVYIRSHGRCCTRAFGEVKRCVERKHFTFGMDAAEPTDVLNLLLCKQDDGGGAPVLKTIQTG